VKRILLLTQHDEYLDFEYEDLVKTLCLRNDLEITLVTKVGYSGVLINQCAQAFQVDLQSKFDLQAILKVRKIVKEQSVEIIYTHTSRASAVSFLATLGISDVSIIVRRGIRGKLSPFSVFDYLSFYNKKISKVIALSQAVKVDLSTSLFFLEKKCIQIYQGISLDNCNFLDTSYVRDQFSIEKNSIFLITISHHRKVKGLDRILSTAKCLSKAKVNFTWVIFGGGTECFSTDYSRGEYQGRVMGLGHDSDAVKYLKAADIYCQPSREEGLCFSLAQAALAGCYCLISDVEAMKEIVKSPDAVLPNDDNCPIICSN